MLHPKEPAPEGGARRSTRGGLTAWIDRPAGLAISSLIELNFGGVCMKSALAIMAGKAFKQKSR